MAQLRNVKILNELLVKHGQGTQTSNKKDVWSIKGLDKRFGKYSGTSSQINVLIKNLKHNPIFDSALSDITKKYSKPELTSPTGIKPLQAAPQAEPSGAAATLATAKQPIDTSYQKRADETIEQYYDRTTTPDRLGELPTDTTIPPLTPTEPTTPTPVSAAGVLPPQPTATQIYKQATESQAFKLEEEGIGLDVSEAQQKAAVDKQTLQQQHQEDLTQLEDTLATRGLFFSGLKTEQTDALISNLASSQLGVDRELANALMRTNLDLKKAIFDSIADVVSEAEAGRKEAITQLNKAGLSVVNGQLVPTLESQKHALALEKEARIAESEAARFELQQAQYELSVAKSDIQLDQAQQRIEIAQRRLDLSTAIAEGKTFNIISQATQNKLAAAGVPNNIAMWMQTNLNNGVTYAELETSLVSEQGLSTEQAKKISSDFKSVMARSGEDELLAMMMGLAGLAGD